MSTSNDKGKAKAVRPLRIIDSTTACSSSENVIVVDRDEETSQHDFEAHRLVESLVVDGKSIARFVWNGHWNEVNKFIMTLTCSLT